MIRKFFLSSVIFFFVSGMSYAGNISSHVDFELGLSALYTNVSDEDAKEIIDGKIGEAFDLGVWAEVVNGLRLGGDFEMYMISVDEKDGNLEGVPEAIESYREFKDFTNLQFNLGAEYAFVDFSSSALYAKLSLGVWSKAKFKVESTVDEEALVAAVGEEQAAIVIEEIKAFDDECEESTKFKQPNLYLGFGWFFSDVNGKFLKDFGSKIELGYQLQKLDEADFNLANIRLKAALTYSIR